MLVSVAIWVKVTQLRVVASVILILSTTALVFRILHMRSLLLHVRVGDLIYLTELKLSTTAGLEKIRDCNRGELLA